MRVPAERSSVQQSSILIVDDENELRDNLVTILEHEGFLVRTASSGADGVQQLTGQRFDVVLLDLIMPDMDGIETMQEMRRLSANTRFIITTAYATLSTAVYAIRKGASDYLAKPFRVEELLSVIRRSLEEARFERRLRLGNLDKTMTSLSNATRRRIIEILRQNLAMRLTDISAALTIEDHTKTMFHLRTLKDAGLVRQTQEKLYALTVMGNNAFNVLNALTLEAE